MHNMIVEVRKDDYLYDGAGGLRGFEELDHIHMQWSQREESSSRRASAIREMETTEDHSRLKAALGQYIILIVPDLIGDSEEG